MHDASLIQRRLEPVVILHNYHMTIVHCTIFVTAYIPKECNVIINNVYTLRGSQVWRPSSVLLTRISYRTQYCLIPLVECKEVFEYTIPSFSVITVARGRSEKFFPGFFFVILNSA